MVHPFKNSEYGVTLLFAEGGGRDMGGGGGAVCIKKRRKFDGRSGILLDFRRTQIG